MSRVKRQKDTDRNARNMYVLAAACWVLAGILKMAGRDYNGGMTCILIAIAFISLAYASQRKMNEKQK